MRILLLGGTGQVGIEVQALTPGREVICYSPRRDVLDLADPQSIAAVVREAPWDAVINAAAYTEVDNAEKNVSEAFALNGEVPRHLAIATGQLNIPLIHISTDYVFDGRKGSPYVEDDPVAPLNVYGQSKLEGERAVLANNPKSVVLRTSWVYSPYRKNFVRTILRLASERDKLQIVSDQRGGPTAASEIARTCLDVAAQCVSRPGDVSYGLYHLAGSGDTTWFEFAQAIVDLSGDHSRHVTIEPIKTSDYRALAVRPLDTRLDCSAIERAFSVKLPHWRESLQETLRRISSN